MAGFAAVPNVPQAGIPDWQFQSLNNLKQNVEMLTGQRGAGASQYRAVLRGDVTTNPAPDMVSITVTFSQTAYTIPTLGDVPKIEDFVALLSTVQGLINDVAALRATVNSLITNLRI